MHTIESAKIQLFSHTAEIKFDLEEKIREALLSKRLPLFCCCYFFLAADFLAGALAAGLGAAFFTGALALGAALATVLAGT